MMSTTSTAPLTAADAAALEDLDRRHLIHPHQTVLRPGRHVFSRGSGSTVWDTTGRDYLDMMGGGNWLAQVGHGRPELAQASADQTGTLEFFSCWREYSNDRAVHLAARLAELSPGDLNKVFFTSGGSEGTDTAVKIVRRYHFEQGNPDRTWIIGRYGSYHGSTLGSGSVTGFDDMQYAVGPTLPHIAKVGSPMPYHAELYGGEDPSDFLLRELEETIARIGADRIAAMIGEPILGGAGAIAPPVDYWPRVRELLSAHGILLIADEVITGFGRSGEWFQSAHNGMDPDVVITAKGITSGYAPLGAVLMRDSIGSAISGGDTHFFHGHTYYGHPVAAAVALANLDLLAGEKLVERASAVGERLARGLAPAADLPVVGDIRQVGAMIGVELVTDRATRENLPNPAVIAAIDELQDVHGVLVRDYGSTVVMGPPLVLTDDEADRATSALVEVLSRLGTDGTLGSR